MRAKEFVFEDNPDYDEDRFLKSDPGTPLSFPKGTTLVNVSDVYDWYKLGMAVSDLDDADPRTFNRGVPHTVFAFGSEEEEHKMIPLLKRLGFSLHDIDSPGDYEKAIRASDVMEHLEEMAMGRRDFLGALGAGAMAAAGVPAQAKSKQPEPTAFLSAHIEAEEMLHKTALRAGMRGAELAQFLAQCYHESAGFGRMHEYATGKEYEGRRDLGNVNRGDGVRYKGRGFIQITGRDNYRRAGQALRLPLEERPDLASRPDVAARIAVWYWSSRVRPNVANFNDTRAVTQQINPKLNGLADRHENFKDYKNMFSITRTGT